MPFFRLTHVAEDEKRAQEVPRASLTWVRDLNSLRRTLTGGSEIYMDLEHWRRTRTVQVTSPPTRPNYRLRPTSAPQTTGAASPLASGEASRAVFWS